MINLEHHGLRIAYQYDGAGPALLLTHGFGATSAMWQGQIAHFKNRYRVITWDMPGHGESSSPDDPSLYSEAQTIDAMAAILDACGESSAIVGGHSLGGYMSLAFYLKYPARTRALMLFNTGPGYKSDTARAEWNVMAEKQANALTKKGLPALGHGEETRLGTHRTALGLAHGARGMLVQKDGRIIESLPHITVPALIVVGAKDRGYLAATDYMAEKIPDSRKVIIPDAGHAANLHQPEAFNAAADEFLQGLQSR